MGLKSDIWRENEGKEEKERLKRADKMVLTAMMEEQINHTSSAETNDSFEQTGLFRWFHLMNQFKILIQLSKSDCSDGSYRSTSSKHWFIDLQIDLLEQFKIVIPFEVNGFF